MRDNLTVHWSRAEGVLGAPLTLGRRRFQASDGFAHIFLADAADAFADLADSRDDVAVHFVLRLLALSADGRRLSRFLGRRQNLIENFGLSLRFKVQHWEAGVADRVRRRCGGIGAVVFGGTA